MTIENSLQRVEECLRQQCETIDGVLRTVCLAALEGGHRVRGRLLLNASERHDATAIQAACALEMLHAATLLQDDIFDGSTLRRGEVASYLRFGKAHTVLASDWLLIRSLQLAAGVHTDYFNHLAKTASAMAQAVAEELEPRPLLSVAAARAHMASVIHGKTAATFASALHGAALLRSVGPEELQAWDNAGHQAGYVYQLVDDCMDIYADPACLNKDAEQDLKSGRATLPLLLARARVATGVPMLGNTGAVERGPHTVTHEARLRSALHSDDVCQALQRCIDEELRKLDRAFREAHLPASAATSFLQEMTTRLRVCFHEAPRAATRTKAPRMCEAAA